MPPYQNASHDHAHPSSSSQNPVANSQRSSVASTTSYTSLGHALAPAASRAPDSHHHRQPTPKNSRPPPQMASEGRYMYPPQDVPPAPSYPYAYPTAPPYENGQYTQSSSRAPVRSPPPPQPVSHPPPQQPVSHPPPPAPYNGAHPPYPPQPGYPQPAYGVPPQQWSGEWSHYNPPYPPTAPPGQSPYPPPGAPGARPDLSPNTPHDDRRYAQPPSRQEPQSRRTEERPPQRPEAAPPPPAPVRKTRENDPPAPAHAPPPPAPVAAQAPAPPPPPHSTQSGPPAITTSAVGIDFVKLLESYRLIIDSTNAIAYEATPARPPPPADTLERMLQAAAYGAQVLDAAAKRIIPEPPRPPPDRSPDEGDEDANRARQGENQPPTEGQTCLGCAATSTPEWRRGPMGPRTLCNACGLVYAKLIKKRNRNEPGRGRGGGQPARSTGQIVSGPVDEPGMPGQDEPSDSDSDDDGSYGSQQDGRYRRD